jgi:hypothetical protein
MMFTESEPFGLMQELMAVVFDNAEQLLFGGRRLVKKSR